MSIRRQVTAQHLQGNVMHMSMVKSTATIIRGRQKPFKLQVQTTKNWRNRLKLSCQYCQVKTLNFLNFSSRGTHRTAMLWRFCHKFYILLCRQSFLSLSHLVFAHCSRVPTVYHSSCHCPVRISEPMEAKLIYEKHQTWYIPLSHTLYVYIQVTKPSIVAIRVLTLVYHHKVCWGTSSGWLEGSKKCQTLTRDTVSKLFASRFLPTVNIGIF